MHYEIGDILIFKVNRRDKENIFQKIFAQLQLIFDGKASHTEIITHYDAQTNTVTTLGSNSDGVKLRIWDIQDKNFAVGRLKGGVNQRKALYVLEILESKYLGTEYSYRGLFNASINAIVEKFIPKIWKKKIIIKEKDKFFCSELVGEFIELVDFNKKISTKYEKNISKYYLTPSDIYTSKDIMIIKDFGWYYEFARVELYTSVLI